MAGYALWKVLFGENNKVLFLSKDQDAAKELLGKSRYIYDHLPPFMQRKLKHPDSPEVIDFANTHSIIKTFPSTKDAGKGTDASLIVRDELAEHPYGDENYRSISPAVDAGGQLIELSTIVKSDYENYFSIRARKAAQGDIGSKFIFLGWRLRPVREEGLTLEQWFENKIKPNYDDWEIEQNYPATQEEAFSSPEAQCRFDDASLKAMKAMCDSPIRYERNGIVRIYREPQVGFKYIFAIDPSRAGEDPSTGIIVESQAMFKVADFRGMITIQEQASIIEELQSRYNRAFTIIERNAGGVSLLDALENSGITNFYKDDKDKLGWYTGAINRTAAINELAEAVHHRSFRDLSEDSLNQFLSFIRTKKKPEGVAIRGAHDDFVMAWMLAFQARKKIPVGDFKITTFRPKVRV